MSAVSSGRVDPAQVAGRVAAARAAIKAVQTRQRAAHDGYDAAKGLAESLKTRRANLDRQLKAALAARQFAAIKAESVRAKANVDAKHVAASRKTLAASVDMLQAKADKAEQEDSSLLEVSAHGHGHRAVGKSSRGTRSVGKTGRSTRAVGKTGRGTRSVGKTGRGTRSVGKGGRSTRSTPPTPFVPKPFVAPVHPVPTHPLCRMAPGQQSKGRNEPVGCGLFYAARTKLMASHTKADTSARALHDATNALDALDYKIANLRHQLDMIDHEEEEFALRVDLAARSFQTECARASVTVAAIAHVRPQLVARLAVLVEASIARNRAVSVDLQFRVKTLEMQAVQKENDIKMASLTVISAKKMAVMAAQSDSKPQQQRADARLLRAEKEVELAEGRAATIKQQISDTKTRMARLAADTSKLEARVSMFALVVAAAEAIDLTASTADLEKQIPLLQSEHDGVTAMAAANDKELSLARNALNALKAQDSPSVNQLDMAQTTIQELTHNAHEYAAKQKELALKMVVAKQQLRRLQTAFKASLLQHQIDQAPKGSKARQSMQKELNALHVPIPATMSKLERMIRQHQGEHLKVAHAKSLLLKDLLKFSRAANDGALQVARKREELSAEQRLATQIEDKFNAAVDAESKNVPGLKKQLADQRAKVKQVEQSLPALQAKVKEARKSFALLNGQMKSLERESDGLITQAAQAQTELAAAGAVATVLPLQIAERAQAEAALQAELNEVLTKHADRRLLLNQKREKLKESCRAADRLMNELKHKAGDCKTVADADHVKVQEMQTRVNQMSHTIDALRAKMREQQQAVADGQLSVHSPVFKQLNEQMIALGSALAKVSALEERLQAQTQVSRSSTLLIQQKEDRVRQLLANQADLANDIAQLKAQLVVAHRTIHKGQYEKLKLIEALKDKERYLRDLYDAKAALKFTVGKLADELNKCRLEKADIKSKLSAAKFDAYEARGALKSLQNEAARLENRVMALRIKDKANIKQIAALKTKLGDAEDENDEIEELVEASKINMGKLREAQKHLDKIGEDMEELRPEYMSLQVHTEKLEEDLHAKEHALAAQQGVLKAHHQQLQNLKGQMNEGQKLVASLQGRLINTFEKYKKEHAQLLAAQKDNEEHLHDIKALQTQLKAQENGLDKKKEALEAARDKAKLAALTIKQQKVELAKAVKELDRQKALAAFKTKRLIWREKQLHSLQEVLHWTIIRNKELRADLDLKSLGFAEHMQMTDPKMYEALQDDILERAHDLKLKKADLAARKKKTLASFHELHEHKKMLRKQLDDQKNKEHLALAQQQSIKLLLAELAEMRKLMAAQREALKKLREEHKAAEACAKACANAKTADQKSACLLQQQLHQKESQLAQARAENVRLSQETSKLRAKIAELQVKVNPKPFCDEIDVLLEVDAFGHSNRAVRRDCIPRPAASVGKGGRGTRAVGKGGRGTRRAVGKGGRGTRRAVGKGGRGTRK